MYMVGKPMQRRAFNLALCFTALTPGAFAAEPTVRGPAFWVIRRGKARIYLLGFGEGKVTDESWFTPTIRSAFGDSSVLWLETAPAEAVKYPDDMAKARAHDEYEGLRHEPAGRRLFDELEPTVRERLLAYMAELGVKKEAVENLRPWAAYYVINGAFWSKQTLPYESVNVDVFLWKKATSQGKEVTYEQPNGLSFATFMAGMPEKAQSQYIEWLLDFLDDYKKGALEGSFDWMHGGPRVGTRSLDRMRSRMPDLYQSMQIQRNTWWCHKIGELLAAGGTNFIAIGQLHVLGPDGIPNKLIELKVVDPSDIKKI
jgi:uncharacterized protein YbaP (TraB family)